jgi:uncharacterized membrane protein YdcZ (DUF606 family)
VGEGGALSAGCVKFSPQSEKVFEGFENPLIGFWSSGLLGAFVVFFSVSGMGELGTGAGFS